MVTLRDIQRSVTQTIRNATADSDGQDTLDVIDAFLDSRKASTSPATPAEMAAADRLSADLYDVCDKTVLQHPEAALVSSQPAALRLHNQHFLILRFIRQLLPVLGPSRIFGDWWTPVLKPILSSASYTDQIKNESRSILADCLVLEQRQEGDEKPYCEIIMDEYLAWAENYHHREQELLDKSFEDKSFEQDETTRLRLQHQALLELEQDEWSKNIVSVLMTFGAQATKQFFMILNRYFVSSKHRLQIVYLLSGFLLRKRTHLHEILETNLFESMLKSLMYDNSTTLIAISVTNLIMLLPRICTSLPPFLPRLFYIFARALCWDQLRDIRRKQGQSADRTTQAQAKQAAANDWDCADYTFSKLSAPPSNPQTGLLFTSLYGLYPCNFLKFLHKPYAYFEEYDFSIPEEFDEETFRARTIAQVTRHMLHPNLVMMDTETELTDRSRWMKMESPDIMAQIMSLDLTNAASRVAFSSAVDTVRGSQEDLLDDNVWKHYTDQTQPETHTATNTDENESPTEESAQITEAHVSEKQETTESPAAVATPPAVTVQSILQLHKALKSGTEVLLGDDVWDADLEHLASPSPSNPASPPFPDPVSLSAAAATLTGEASAEQDSDGAVDAGVYPATGAMSSNETKLLIAALKREVLLLRNELNFELFVKQQHLQHMGRLHREHVSDSSVEAERQRTYNATRILKAQLAQATDALTKLKSESAKTKQKHVKWEDEQSSKLRNYRERWKAWQAEMEAARQQLADYEKRFSDQSAQLAEVQQRAFDLENELKTREPQLKKAEELEIRVNQLTQQMLLWDKDLVQLDEQKRCIKVLLSEWQNKEELIRSLENTNKRLLSNESTYQAEQGHLQEQLRELQERQTVIQSSAADAQNSTSSKKQTEQLREAMRALQKKLEELEVEKLEWKAQKEALTMETHTGVKEESSAC